MKKVILFVCLLALFLSCYVAPPQETPKPTTQIPAVTTPAKEQPALPAPVQKVCETGAELIVGTDAQELYPQVNPLDTNLVVYIACGAGELTSYDIWLYRIPEKSAIRVTTDGFSNELFPSWTKDGKSIIFDSDKIPGTGRTLWQIDAAGGNKPTRLLLSESQVAIKGSISPSPSGTQEIVFESPRSDMIQQLMAPYPNSCQDKTFPRQKADFKSRIWTMNPNGTGLRCLTDGQYPAWSPLGDKIAYASNASGNWDIWIMDNKGGNQVQLTSSPSNEIEPSWSPDGQSIVFVSDQSGNWDIWAISIDGGPKMQLTSSNADEGGPFWSSNGYIYYHSYCRGNWDIWRIPAPPLKGPSQLVYSKKGLAKEARIEVLNGTRIKGLAAKVAQMLTDMGYNVVKIGNARTKKAKTTRIYYSLEYKEIAKELADILPREQYITPRGFLSPASDITIIVGANMR